MKTIVPADSRSLCVYCQHLDLYRAIKYIYSTDLSYPQQGVAAKADYTNLEFSSSAVKRKLYTRLSRKSHSSGSQLYIDSTLLAYLYQNQLTSKAGASPDPQLQQPKGY